MNSHDSNEWFYTTQWSIVLAARDHGDQTAGRALEELCRTYWRPLYAFLRRSGQSPHDAQDLTQSFFVQLIDKEYLRSVDQAKGRFRSFLLVAIKHFVSNRRAYENAIKRGGKQQRLALDYADVEQVLALSKGSESPDREFEYDWALAVLERTLDEVRSEFIASGKAEHFDVLKAFLTPSADLPTFAQLAKLLKLSESGARSTVHRLRSRYRRALRHQVAQTVGSEEDIDDELRQLMAILARR